MNNLLIIPNADFSDVRVEKILMKDKVFLSEGQYSDKLLKYFSANSSTGVYSYAKGNSGTYLLLFAINKGTYVVVDNQNSRYGIGLIKDNNTTSPHFMKNSGYFDKANDTNGEVRLLAEEDGYVVIYSKASNVDIFPTSVYLTGIKPLSRILNTNNKAFSVSRILQSDGTFSSYVEGSLCCLYNVFAGETVNITANSSYGTKYAFLDFDKYLIFAHNSFSQDGLIELNAGDTNSVVVQKQCLLYVMANDGTNDTFPSSLSIEV